MLKLKTLDAFYKIQGFALYNSFKPNTKLEKVGDIEQLDLQNLKASLKNNKRQDGKLISLENTLNY